MHLVLICVSILFIATPLASAAQSSSESERTADAVKGALLNNFGNYVKWPANYLPESSRKVIIGVLGRGKGADSIHEKILLKPISGKAVVKLRFSSIEEIVPTHILFIADSDLDTVKAARAKLAKQSTVIVVDNMEQFAQSLAVFNFVIKESNVRFEINDSAANAIGVEISTPLKGLAEQVY